MGFRPFTLRPHRTLLRVAPVVTLGVLLAHGPAAHGASPAYERCAARIDTGALTSSQRLDCATKDMDRADQALNATYRDTMARLAPGRQATLRREERAWIEQRRAKCSLANQAADPSRDLNRMLCLVSETDDRTGVLRAMR